MICYGHILTDAQVEAGLAAIVDGCTHADVESALRRAGVTWSFIPWYAATRLLTRERQAGRIWRDWQGRCWRRVEERDL